MLLMAIADLNGARVGRRAAAVGAGANVLSFGRFENADRFAAAFA